MADELEEARDALADACWEAQRESDWDGLRVVREGVTWDVERDDGRAQLVARDVHLDARRTWDRREFLSRGLTVVDPPVTANE